MKNKAWLILFVISFVAALALALTNLVTEGPIKEQNLKASNASRLAAMPNADAFEEQALVEGAAIDSLYAAAKGGELVGYIGQATASGYGGKIEVVLGIDKSGKITGISVGGPEFAETAGLGSRTRDPEFTDQFLGLSASPSLGGNIDGISGATISSTAVADAAKKVYDYAAALMGGGEVPVAEELIPITVDDRRTVTVHGFKDEIQVTVGLNPDGTIEAIEVGGDKFNESPGYGARALEPEFLNQFAGKTPPLRYRARTDASASTTSGATAASADAASSATSASTDAASSATGASANTGADAATSATGASTDAASGATGASANTGSDAASSATDAASSATGASANTGADATSSATGASTDAASSVTGASANTGADAATSATSASTDAASSATGASANTGADAATSATGASTDAASSATGASANTGADAASSATDASSGATGAATIGIIGGSDGPTAVYVSGNSTGADAASSATGSDASSGATNTAAASANTDDSSKLDITEVTEAIGDEIDAIAGATITSNAILKAVNEACGF